MQIFQFIQSIWVFLIYFFIFLPSKSSPNKIGFDALGSYPDARTVKVRFWNSKGGSEFAGRFAIWEDETAGNIIIRNINIRNLNINMGKITTHMGKINMNMCKRKMCVCAFICVCLWVCVCVCVYDGRAEEEEVMER